MTGGATPSAVWSERSLTGEFGERDFSVGPLRLRLRRTGDEIWLAHARERDSLLPGRRPEPPARTPAGTGGEEEDGGAGPPSPEAPEAPAAPETEEWTRWAVPDGSAVLRLSPAFPDRPLVVEPEQAFHLLRGARARIYIRVPLWVRVELLGRHETVLTEVPTTLLSDTWFGDPTEGELAYFLPTSARRTISPELFEAHRVICPLHLSNPSGDDLLVQKIALRVAHLSLYRSAEELWSGETRVQYQGDAVGSTLRMAGGPPQEAPDAERLAEPRTPLDRSLTARTFARLKHMPGFGLPF